MIFVVVTIIIVLAGFIVYIYKAGPGLPPEADAIIESVLNGELPQVVVGRTGFASSSGLNIWYECISPEGPPKGDVLLMMAMGGDALMWPPKFIRVFVDAGYRVTRYDQRGTGMSDWVADWDSKNPYSLADMAQDAVAVLDALEIQKAHLVSLSMGGMVAQEVAICCPDRVLSLTLIMTSGYVVDPDLPGLTSRYFLRYIAKGLPLLKYRLLGGEKNLIKERIAKTMLVARHEWLDIKELAEVVLYDLRKRKGINIKGVLQHQTAVSVSGSRYEKLKTLDMPTLVIHGTADEFIPVAHGRKLAEVIPNAQTLWLEGVGHVFPVPNMDELVKTIISFFDGIAE